MWLPGRPSAVHPYADSAAARVNARTMRPVSTLRPPLRSGLTAVTALPILILLMEKLEILRQPIGQRILRYASLDDIAIWGVLALIMLDWERVGRQVGFLVAFAVLTVLYRRLMVRLSRSDRWYVALIWLVACGFGADWAWHAGTSDGPVATLDVLEEELQGYAGRLKVQVAGPWTLASMIEKPRGDKVLSDHGARRDLAQALAEGVRDHVADLRRRLPATERLVVQVDETREFVAAFRNPASYFARYGDLSEAEACGADALNGLLEVARQPDAGRQDDVAARA